MDKEEMDEFIRRMDDHCKEQAAQTSGTSKSKRVQGGSGWADAVRNFTVSSAEYVEVWLGKVQRRYHLENKDIEYFNGEDFVIISFEQKVLTIASFDFIENKRCESLTAFEEWLVKIYKNNLIIV